MAKQKPLTDAELKAKIIAKASQRQKDLPQGTNNKPTFPTEIVGLPSRGLVYPLDHPLSSGKVEMKYMTAKEEDILTNANLIRQGKALDKLYESLVISNGEGQPVNINDMIVGDRSAMMLAARVLGYGNEYEVELTHPESQKKFKHTVDLNDIKPKPFDETKFNNENRFEFELPITKKKIVFKLQTSREQYAIEQELKRQEAAGHGGSVTTTLKHIILSIDGNDDKAMIRDFVNNHLLARESLELRNYMYDISPDYDLTVKIDRPDVNYKGDMVLPIGTDFFWPRA